MALACKDDAPVLSGTYELGWSDGVRSGECELREEDNCELNYDPPDDAVERSLTSGDDPGVEAYRAGYLDAQDRVMSCADSAIDPSFRTPRNLERVFGHQTLAELLGYSNGWDRYWECRDAQNDNPY